MVESPGSTLRAGTESTQAITATRLARRARLNKDLLHDLKGSQSGKMAGRAVGKRKGCYERRALQARPGAFRGAPPRPWSLRRPSTPPVMQGIAMRCSDTAVTRFSSSPASRGPGPAPSSGGEPAVEGRRQENSEPGVEAGWGTRGAGPPSFRNVSGMFPVGVGSRGGSGPSPHPGQHVLGRVGAGRRWGPIERVLR